MKFNTTLKNYNLKHKSTQFGTLETQCDVRKYKDVENLDSKDGYQIIVRMRVKVAGCSNYEIGLHSSSDGFKDYPALLSNGVSLTLPAGMVASLKSLYPRSLNATVSTTRSSESDNGNSTSYENSSGSSNTNINSYSVSASLGFFGKTATGSVNGGYSHTSEESYSHSFSLGHAQSYNNTIGADDAMTVKDWSSFSKVDVQSEGVSWIWGQSYPWNVIDYNLGTGGGSDKVTLPSIIKDKMICKNGGSTPFALPPSELSLFGIDFVMQAGWLILTEADMPFDDALDIVVDTQSFTATHYVGQDGLLEVKLQKAADANTAKSALKIGSLSALALQAISSSAASNGAQIGFSQHHFMVPAIAADKPFKVLSGENNLQVTGLGFTRADGLQADLSSQEETSVTITFKIGDVDNDYALYLEHWIQNAGEQCGLEYTVNNQWTGSMLVNAVKGAGANSNLSTLELRDTDITSSSFRDYLVVGTNTIELKIPSTSATYTLFAVAISRP